MTEQVARRIWQVLIEECGATDNESSGHGWLSFWHYMNTDVGSWFEFRFMGDLGFGGKFYRQDTLSPQRRYTVDCYQEDMTPTRQQKVDRANRRLADIAMAEQEHLACACDGIEGHIRMLEARP